MFTRDDIPKSGRIRKPITVIVRQRAVPTDERRDFELTVENQAGRQFTLTIWATHNVGAEWIVGHRYELYDVRGKWWKSDGTKDYKLSSTSDLSVTDLGQADGNATLLLVGDTHVGYRHRLRSDKPRWARDVDARGPFERVVEIARQHDVEGIIHAGDVFDHEATADDIQAATAKIRGLVYDEIPFYHIRGNHDTAEAIDALSSLEAQTGYRLQLAMEPVTVGDSRVDVYGTDYTAGELGQIQPLSAGGGQGPNLLVVHETPYPVYDANGTLCYDNGADLRSVVNSSAVEFDFIISGHMHVAQEGRLKGTDIPVIVTGPTIPISQYKQESQPRVWLLECSAAGFDVTQKRI